MNSVVKAISCSKCSDIYDIPLPSDVALASADCPSCNTVNFASRYERIDIGLSEVCNLKCVMCRRPQESEFMTEERVRAVLRDARTIGVTTLSFSGGEPFIHPKFRSFLSLAIELKFSVELVTNGTLVKASDIPLLEKLRCVTVSVDGPRDEHDYIRGKNGCWDRTMLTLGFLSGSKVTWGTNTVIQKFNVESLYPTWAGIRQVGRPSYIAFTHVEVVPETLHLQPTAEQIRRARVQLDRIKMECERDNIHFNDARLLGDDISVFAQKHRRYRPVGGCHIPQTFLGISNYGIFPCWHQGRSISADSLIEALQSDLCRDIVREGLERRCIGCNAANYSWSDAWVSGILEAHHAHDWTEGVVYLSAAEREAGSLRPGKRTLPILERQG